MEFTSSIKEVKAKADDKGNTYVEMKLDAIRCPEIDLEEAKKLIGKAVRVKIESLHRPLPGLEE
jgi:hypothetical protein